MSKIQSRIGASLAALYDVRGSIAGLEDLRQEEVAVVHDMASTAASERLAAAFRRAESGEIGQSANFEVLITGLPRNAYMLHGVQVFTVDTPGDFTRLNVNMRRTDAVGAVQEMTIWGWDGTNTNSYKINDDNSGVASKSVFLQVPETKILPLLMLGTNQPQTIQEVVLHGTTGAFGAGTITVVFLLRLSLFDAGGINRSAYGLTVPSW